MHLPVGHCQGSCKVPLGQRKASWHPGEHSGAIDSHGTKFELLQRGPSWNPGDHGNAVEYHGSKCPLFHIVASKSAGDCFDTMGTEEAVTSQCGCMTS